MSSSRKRRKTGAPVLIPGVACSVTYNTGVFHGRVRGEGKMGHWIVDWEEGGEPTEVPQSSIRPREANAIATAGELVVVKEEARVKVEGEDDEDTPINPVMTFGNIVPGTTVDFNIFFYYLHMRMIVHVESQLKMPTTDDEFPSFYKFVRQCPKDKLKRKYGFQRLFNGKYQPQGIVSKKWQERKEIIPFCVQRLQDANTFKDACDAVRMVPCCGDFIGAQALLDLIYGVFEGEFGALFKNSVSAYDFIGNYCSFGPGPKTSIGKMFNDSVEPRERINFLAKNARHSFKRLGLEFPFLDQEFTPVDMEHSRCYFSRYLSCRELFINNKSNEAKTRAALQPLIEAIDSRPCPRISFKDLANCNTISGLGQLVERHLEKYPNPN
ncbi:hypothetical protein TrVE_jg12721 [Triparma verrucosa]|uniref:5-hmdU DNA kinase helical domain-containing protein n=1 Tax=Triparma verrucosa TaxID=1606542 RepID=A0A9W7FEA1_9STRA|nr:hypothetical protein TrVE_jg12721 [Triparma verrucosa]